MAYIIPEPSTDPVGSGNPNYGSGFTNFDNWLTQWGAEMGAAQEGEVPDDNPYNKWMYEIGQQNKPPPPEAPAPDYYQPQEASPLPLPHGNSNDQGPDVTDQPESRRPSYKQDQIDRNQNPSAYPELDEYGRRNGAW